MSPGKAQAHSEDHCTDKGAHFWSGAWQNVLGKPGQHGTALSRFQVGWTGSALSLGQEASSSGVRMLCA